MTRVGELLTRVMPPTPLARRLSTQSVIYAIGEGVFITGSAVYFTQIVGLSAGEVGLGLTVAGAASFVLAVPTGKLADRIGTKRMWSLGAFASSLLYLLWPLATGLAGFMVLVVLLELARKAAGTSRGAYSIEVFPREERVRSQAFMRAAINIGFSVGALLGGVALAFDSDVYVRLLPLFTALALACNAGYVLIRLPDTRRDRDQARQRAVVDAAKVGRTSALRNRGFFALTTFDGVLGTNQVLLAVLIPLWLVQETDAPRVLLAWLVGTNTVLTVLLQVRAARGVDSVTTSLRASRISAVFFVASCGLVLVTHDTVGWVTIALVWAGHLTVTGAELFQSAGEWGYLSELSDPERRGEYQGVALLGHTLGSVWAPALYTFLTMEWGSTGWLVIAAIVVAATAGMGPAARSAERYLASITADEPPAGSAEPDAGHRAGEAAGSGDTARPGRHRLG